MRTATYYPEKKLLQLWKTPNSYGVLYNVRSMASAMLLIYATKVPQTLQTKHLRELSADELRRILS